MAITARYIVQTAPEQFDLRSCAVPDPPVDGAIVELEACGVCGTDAEIFFGELPVPFPLLPGHEPLGRIAAIGREARERWRLNEGDRLAINSTLRCGRCDLCRSDAGCRDAYLGRTPNVGQQHPDRPPAPLWGGFSTHLILPASALFFRVQQPVTTAELSLYNALGNGLRCALEEARVQPGQRVAVLGPGPRGLAAAIGARLAGAEQVIVTGLARDAERLRLVRELAADAVVNAEATDVVEAVRELTGGRGPDAVIDMTPYFAGAVTQAVQMVARRGTVVLFGIKGGRPVSDFPSDLVVSKQITIRGATSSSPTSMERAVRLIESRRLPLEQLATHAFPLERAEEAIRTVAGQREARGLGVARIEMAPVG